MEVFFYHLTSQPLERALPALLEMCMKRDLRAIVEVGSEQRRDALDNHLWVYREDSFLAHGCEPAEGAEDHPIWLTTKPDNSNKANVRFQIDGTDYQSGEYDRVCYIFDGNDQSSVEHARGRWKAEKANGFEVTYWKQDENGRWQKMA